ncbi:hypothetical protein SERLADRAFT_432546 [Serpula lacrymans var. lacrymans S7.9]|uniref:Uncharacterized protein n=1 Tax=Serpula lacrymans var. lacrymans (strain S7.9) TaxID=578457 RepID=F8NFP9_SERL9|nr:uncharacterized protein SERLADRAFT_432546 [Serpula lacrymans var. lacrymans S7.9]EGO30889.1 hypothetical protein SERLADRAFT_432546 [Serpula lacrymans var. lacrymans S7.9]
MGKGKGDYQGCRGSAEEEYGGGVQAVQAGQEDIFHYFKGLPVQEFFPPLEELNVHHKSCTEPIQIVEHQTMLFNCILDLQDFVRITYFC